MTQRKILKGKTNLLKAAVVIAIALAFVTPGSAAVANQSEIMTDNKIITDSKLSNTAVRETLNITIYVDDNNTQGPWDGTLAHPYQYIQNGIDAAAEGDTVYVFNGNYQESLTINKPLEVVGESNMDTRIVSPESNRNLQVLQTNNVVFHNFHMERDGGGTTWMNYIYAEFCSYSQFYDLVIGQEAAKDAGFELVFCDNLTVRDIYINTFNRDFFIVATEYSLFKNLDVYLVNPSECAFNVYGGYDSTGQPRGSLWNTYEDMVLNVEGCDRGFQGAWIDNSTIQRITVFGGGSVGILAENAPDTVISNCTVGGNYWGISFNNAPRGKILNCTSTYSGGSTGIGAWYGDNVTIDNCLAENNAGIGLLILGAVDSCMSNCTSLNTTYEGIDIISCENTVVTGCTVYNAGGVRFSETKTPIEAPSVTAITVSIGPDAKVTPMITSEMLLKRSRESVGSTVPITSKKVVAAEAEGEEGKQDYAILDYSKDYVDVRGLPVGEEIPLSIPQNLNVEQIMGIGFWENQYSSILDCTITNMPLGIDLISSPYTTLRNNVLVNSAFYINGAYDQDIDDSNTIDGKPLMWMDGQSNQVLDNPDVGFLAVVNSDNITVQNFDMSNNCWGLLLFKTMDSTVQNCNFSDNIRGLGINTCSRITVQNTIMNNNYRNLDIYSGNPGTNTIDTTNTINGKPIQYLKSLNHETVDGDTIDIGYLALFSCDDVTVQNVAMNSSVQGVLVGDSINITFSDCNFSNNDMGLLVYNSEVSLGESLGLVEFTNNEYGIYLDHDAEITGFDVSGNINNIYLSGDNNQVTGCIVSNGDTGIYIGPDASYNEVDQCEATSNYYGFYIEGDSNMISNISTSDNYVTGVYFIDSAYNIVTNWNSYYDYRGSWANTGYHNTISDSIIDHANNFFIWHYNCIGDVFNNITASHLIGMDWPSGIMLSASEGFTVTNCEVYDSPIGIEIAYLPGDNHTIDNCYFHDISNYGIGLEIGMSWDYGDLHGLFAGNNNTISNCTLLNNNIGFMQQRFARATTVTNCTISGSVLGMWLQFVQDTIVKDTIIYNNTYNFGMPGYKLAHFLTNDIQNTTLVEGKPVQIILGQSNLFLDNPDVGWLGVIQCTNITLKNFNMTHNGQGVLFVATTDSTISNCYFTQNRLSIELYGCQDFTIINSTASDGAGGILIYDSNDITISNCEASNNAGGGDPGIFLMNASYSMVTDSDCSANTYPDSGTILSNFAVNSGSNNTVTNVTMFDVQCALSLATSNDNHFSRLTILQFTYMGVYFYGGVRNELSDSTVRYGQTTQTYASINLEQSSYNHISNCTVRDSPGPEMYGLALTYSSNYNLVENCLVQNASLYYGIAIFYSANNNRIRNCQSFNAPSGQGCYVREASGNVYENCTSSYNAQWGFRVRIATGNKIVNCTAAYNTVGIYAHETSHDNMFFYNNLYGNTQSQAYDNNVNTWDDGTHGNYYSDYNGTDTNGDGVGDTPYAIPDVSNLDHYPKMLPYPNLPPIAVFSWTPVIPYINETVQFDSSDSYDPDDSIATWYWTFGDGADSYDANPTHIYTTHGLFTVTLTLTDHWNPPSTTTITKAVNVSGGAVNFTINITGGLGVTAKIKNTGTIPATDIQWTFTLTGGFVLLGKTKSGTLTSLVAGALATVKDRPILGFGKTTIKVDVTCAEGASATKTATGTVFLFFVLGVK
jgi:parallel beta-helix repeat protein